MIETNDETMSPRSATLLALAGDAESGAMRAVDFYLRLRDATNLKYGPLYLVDMDAALETVPLIAGGFSIELYDSESGERTARISARQTDIVACGVSSSYARAVLAAALRVRAGMK